MSVTKTPKNKRPVISSEQKKEFDTLVKSSMSTIKYRAMYYIQNSKEDREELIQNTLLKAYLYFSTFDKSRGDFIGWISFVMKSVMVDEYRRNKLKKSLTSTIDEENEEGLSISNLICGNDFERIEKKIELKEIYLQKIANLPEIQKNVFEMLIDGFSMKEIATSLNKNESFVKVLIFRVRETLREYRTYNNDF